MLQIPRLDAEAPPALVLSELPRWAEILAGDEPLPDLDRIERVDTAGLQLLASVMLWRPGRLRLDLSGSSPVARMWRRLGLDRPADAEAVEAEGALVALRRGEVRA